MKLASKQMSTAAAAVHAEPSHGFAVTVRVTQGSSLFTHLTNPEDDGILGPPQSTSCNRDV